jgi:hypothetical protein
MSGQKESIPLAPFERGSAVNKLLIRQVEYQKWLNRLGEPPMVGWFGPNAL